MQALRAFVQAHDTAALCAEMGASAANIADTIPEVRERCSDLPPPPRVDDPAQARFRLFDAIRSFLHQAARRHPVVLILDNLHWADTPSLRLLAFLAPELESSQVLVVGSYRDGELSRRHPLSDTLGELTRQPRFQRLRPHGLSHEDVGRFLEGEVGRAPAPELVAALHGQTEGNPPALCGAYNRRWRGGRVLRRRRWLSRPARGDEGPMGGGGAAFRGCPGAERPHLGCVVTTEARQLSSRLKKL